MGRPKPERFILEVQRDGRIPLPQEVSLLIGATLGDLVEIYATLHQPRMALLSINRIDRASVTEREMLELIISSTGSLKEYLRWYLTKDCEIDYSAKYYHPAEKFQKIIGATKFANLYNLLNECDIEASKLRWDILKDLYQESTYRRMYG